MTPTTHSQEMGKLAAAICKVQTTVKPVVKDKTAEAGKYAYDYADLASVWATCRKEMGEAGVAIFQPVSAEGARVVVTTLLVHAESGQWLRSEMEIIAAGSGAQAIGSACSYARRYSLLSSLCLVAQDDDDDGQAAQEKPRQETRSPVPQETPMRLTHDEIKQKLDEAQSTKAVVALQNRWINPEAGDNKEHPLRVHARERYRVLDAQEKAAAKAAAGGGAA